jgi:hypothetical protein
MATSSAADMETFLTGLAGKDRSNIEKHLAACDAEPDPTHGKLWRRLAVGLRRLAPLPVQTVGQHAVQFFIADGKYRMQVFALEDARDGRLMVYLPDILAQAEKAGAPLGVLKPEALDAANTPNPSPHIKHMLGWNRKALRISLSANGSPTQAAAVEALCELAAKGWAESAAAKVTAEPVRANAGGKTSR